MSRVIKRARTNGDDVVFVQASRNVQKEVISVQKAGIGASGVGTTIFTATVPGTMQGLRWSVSSVQDAGSANTTLRWAIVLVKSGDSANTMSGTDGATFYSPEGHLLTFGTQIQSRVDINTTNASTGSTKTMRKMMAGDFIEMIMVGSATNTWSVSATVQLFFKS